MDAGAKKLLETVTIQTLHANNFSRASTQATQVITDLLSRYLSLLAATCAKYAEHAGRLRLTAQDTVAALGELGVGVEELSEFYATEGRELSRYARHSMRRIEDLNEFKAALSVGMREDVDAISLVYAPLRTPELSEDEDETSESEEDEAAEPLQSVTGLKESIMGEKAMDIQPIEMLSQQSERVMSSPRPITPTLPLSPISNPATPPRKRLRTSSWSPPPHVPDFLPPFPTATPRHELVPEEDESAPPAEYSSHLPVKLERPLTPPPEATSSGSADYLHPTPFAQSSLASMPWHLPDPPPATLRLPPVNPSVQALPRPDEAIIFALHHALTNKPPEQPPPANPARYKVALKLVEQTEKNPRWEPPPTLYASSAPNLPRVATVGPGFPIPVAYDERAKEAKDKGKEMELEQAMPTVPGMARRTVIPHERIAPVLNGYTTKMSALLKGVVEYGAYQRSAKLSHPPVLSRGSQKLTYGPGIAAPWNSGPAPAITPVPNGLKGMKDKDKDEKDALPKPLPDARLYTTWNWEEKSYREHVPTGRRARMNSVQLSTPIIGNGKRARSESHT